MDFNVGDRTGDVTMLHVHCDVGDFVVLNHLLNTLNKLDIPHPDSLSFVKRDKRGGFVYYDHTGMNF